MPLLMSAELQFPMGKPTPLNDEAATALLSIARKISSDNGQKYVLETFKRQFCRASGAPYSSSSSEEWAESDLRGIAEEASDSAPGFIAAFYGACEDLQDAGSTVPNEEHINGVLREHSVPFRVKQGELLKSQGFVEAPEPPPQIEEVVRQALNDAKTLIGQTGAASAVDRVHTALHSYLIDLCFSADIDYRSDVTVSKAFKLLRQEHPAFDESGHRAADINRILSSFASVVDAMTPLRNKASLAHANKLLAEAEAMAVVNAAYTIFQYVHDVVDRHDSKENGAGSMF